MIIQQKTGRILVDEHLDGKVIEVVYFEWYEAQKRILRKKTTAGTDISLKFLDENPQFTEGDVLFENEEKIIVVRLLPCDCLVIKPRNSFEIASICYEIGNKHLPLFYENDELLVPFEQPLFRLLTAQGYELTQEKRQLIHPLKTTVAPHGNANESLFSKIMKLTTHE
ncbi:MAG: urease accessory protein UreE [Saprospiraceae bacterium]|nr:urease accessory protein UreE [Saprospiraceae bacterium]